MSTRSDMDALVKDAEAQGWRVETTSKGWLKWIPPDPDAEIIIGTHEPAGRDFNHHLSRMKRMGYKPTERKRATAPQPQEGEEMAAKTIPMNHRKAEEADKVFNILDDLRAETVEFRPGMTAAQFEDAMKHWFEQALLLNGGKILDGMADRINADNAERAARHNEQHKAFNAETEAALKQTDSVVRAAIAKADGIAESVADYLGKIDEASAKVSADAARIGGLEPIVHTTAASALALESMVNELADQFSRFRNATSDTIPALRADVRDIKAELDKRAKDPKPLTIGEIEAAMRSYVSAQVKTLREELEGRQDRAMATLRADLTAMIQSAQKEAERTAALESPLEALRKRLAGKGE